MHSSRRTFARTKGTDCPADWRGMNLTAGRRHMRSAHLQRARYDKMRPGSRPSGR